MIAPRLHSPRAAGCAMMDSLAAQKFVSRSPKKGKNTAADGAQAAQAARAALNIRDNKWAMWTRLSSR